MSGTARGRIARVLAATGALAFATALLAADAASLADPAAHRAAVPMPRVLVESGTRCILPAAQMRRTHMDLLRHQRDRTVREGRRGAQVSLAQCIECHATPVAAATATSAAPASAALPVRSVLGGPDAFCQSCHQYVGVTLDCFECHQPKAPARAQAPLREASTR